MTKPAGLAKRGAASSPDANAMPPLHAAEFIRRCRLSHSARLKEVVL